MATHFLQIHTLTNYPATLLNRDDAGFAKRMPFGGAVRTRISSQCLKRHWRTSDGEERLCPVALDSVRSREVFTRLVLPPVIEGGVTEQRARWAVGAMMALLQVGLDAKSKQKRATTAKQFAGVSPGDDETAQDANALKQVVVLGPGEVEYLVSEAVALAGMTAKDDELVELARERATKDESKNREALAQSVTMGAGISAALFGRMRTGDLFADLNAAIHVAHAMTVHGQMTESDYFTAIDDLVREDGEQGSGHINASELTSGLFYGYVVVDVNGLVKNLGSDSQLAGEVVEKLIHIIAKVSPGAKKGSTAPYSYSHLVLVESGDAQPRTLQNAFIEPVRTAGNVVHNAYDAMQAYLCELDTTYGKSESRAHAGIGTDGRFEGKMRLSELAAWAKAQVVG